MLIVVSNRMGDRLEILLLTASSKSKSTFPACVTGDMEQIMLGIPFGLQG
jgi:hypothetical protein